METLVLAAEVSPNAVDWTTVLLALISALVSIGTAVIGVFAAKYAAAASTSAREARDRSSEAVTAVDGVKAELVAAKEGKARAEGMLIGQGAAAAAAQPRSDPPAT